MELQDWLIAITKTQMIYDLTEREALMLAYDYAEGTIYNFIGGLWQKDTIMT